jgi:hypothetical protein
MYLYCNKKIRLIIHGGLYYPNGSLKARTCVAGRRRLYGYCGEHGVPHARIGKLTVATSEAEIPALEKIRPRGVTVWTIWNGWISGERGGLSLRCAARRACCRPRPASSIAMR